MKQIRRILYPTDFSSISARAFGQAVRLAKACWAEVFVMHVLTPGASILADDNGAMPDAYAVIDRSLHGRAKRQLDTLVTTGQAARRPGDGPSPRRRGHRPDRPHREVEGR